MTKCQVCMMEYDESIKGNVCPRCGHHYLFLADNSEESRAKRDKLIRQYRREHWANAPICLTVFRNTENGGSVSSREESLLLGKTKELEIGEVCWQTERFARLSGEELELSVNIKLEGWEDCSYKLPVSNPKVQDFRKLGLCRKSEDSYTLLVGTPKQYSESEQKQYSESEPFFFPPQDEP